MRPAVGSSERRAVTTQSGPGAAGIVKIPKATGYLTRAWLGLAATLVIVIILIKPFKPAALRAL